LASFLHDLRKHGASTDFFQIAVYYGVSIIHKANPLFWQVELVKNKETREPFIAEDRFTTFSGNLFGAWPIKLISKYAGEKGVLVGGFVPNTLRMGGACTTTKEEIDMVVDALDYAFKNMEKDLLG
jgi:taurine--2-oxoglutarate transaminase